MSALSALLSEEFELTLIQNSDL